MTVRIEWCTELTLTEVRLRAATNYYRLEKIGDVNSSVCLLSSISPSLFPLRLLHLRFRFLSSLCAPLLPFLIKFDFIVRP